MPTYKQRVSSWVTHLARTHPVVASLQLVHFSILLPADNRLPGLRCFEIFLCENFTDVRFELGQQAFSPVRVHVPRIDYLGIQFVARLHCSGLTLIGRLQTTSSVCGNFCLETDTLSLYRFWPSFSPAASFLAVFSAAVRNFFLGLLMRFVSLGFLMHLPVTGSIFHLPPISASREKNRRLQTRKGGKDCRTELINYYCNTVQMCQLDKSKSEQISTCRAIFCIQHDTTYSKNSGPGGDPRVAAIGNPAVRSVIVICGRWVGLGGRRLGAGAVPPGAYFQTPRCH